MTDIQVNDLIAKLEKSIEGEKAIAKFRSFGEVALYANQAGYLKIAIEMLKSAIGEQGSLQDLFQQDSDFGIDFMVTSEKELDFYSQ